MACRTQLLKKIQFMCPKLIVAVACWWLHNLDFVFAHEQPIPASHLSTDLLRSDVQLVASSLENRLGNGAPNAPLAMTVSLGFGLCNKQETC
jgi:hypothetical protein